MLNGDFSLRNRQPRLKSYGRSKFSLMNMLDMLDLFKRRLPTFNMRGSAFVPSIAGGLLSFTIFFVMLMYATVKFIHMLNRHNPSVSSYLKSSFLDSSNIVNFKDKNLRFAFGVEGYLDKELKDDPKFVKSILRFMRKVEGVEEERFVNYHKCTALDFEDFAPPSSDSIALLHTYKTDPSRNLYCINFDELGNDMEIWGV